MDDLDLSDVDIHEKSRHEKLGLLADMLEDARVQLVALDRRLRLLAATRDALDATAPDTGFGEGCLPGTCYRYVVTVDGGDVTALTTRDALANFIGDIDSRDEAILRVAARAHTWWDDGAHTGIRPAVDGWDIVVLETVAFCEPIQTDRVRFYIGLDGRILAGAREVWQQDESGCI